MWLGCLALVSAGAESETDEDLSLAGSPADKADLEVGDEILEVNGKSMEEATHGEVISHIHQVRIRYSRYVEPVLGPRGLPVVLPASAAHNT